MTDNLAYIAIDTPKRYKNGAVELLYRKYSSTNALKLLNVDVKR